jgi:hypothetical protein
VSRRVSVIGFFSPTLEILSTNLSKETLLRTRRLGTLMRSMGTISTTNVSSGFRHGTISDSLVRAASEKNFSSVSTR